MALEGSGLLSGGGRQSLLSGRSGSSLLDKGSNEAPPEPGAAQTDNAGVADAVRAAFAQNPTAQGIVGLGRGFINLISRPLYAAAGGVEEAIQPASPVPGYDKAQIVSRVGQELLSGLPGVQGKKREFTEVMQRAGVPELGHLHDVLPYVPVPGGLGVTLAPTEGSAIDVTGRGTLGLAANIALDPLTWLTYGGSQASKFATADGVLHLSKKGTAVKDALVNDLAPTYRLLAESPDRVLAETGRRQVREVLESRVKAAAAADPSLLEKTGLKFGGLEVVSPESMRNLTDTVKTMVQAFPGGQKAATAASAFGDAMRSAFDKFAPVAGLDEGTRVGITNKVRDYENAMAANATREAAAVESIVRDEKRLAAKYGPGDTGIQILGKKFADWRQKTGTPDLTKDEQDLFARVAANYDQRGITNVRNGVISGEQYDKYQGSYLHQSYKNPEALQEVAQRARETGLIPPTKVNKEREFDTFADAVRISRGVRQEGMLARERGVARPVYPELIPEYGISKNLWQHVEQSNRAIWQKKLFEDIRDTYGLDVSQAYDPSRVYALREPIPVPQADRAVIDAAVAKVGGKAEEFTNSVNDAAKVLPKLSADGQRELARASLAKANSEAQAFAVRNAFGDALMPKVTPKRPGDVEPFFLRHGMAPEQAALVKVSGGLWGDEPHLVPKAIADLVDTAPRSAVLDPKNKSFVARALRVYDWHTNLFKAATYPFYPAGATRDAYNNLQQGFMALGIGGLLRPLQSAKVAVGVEDAVKIGGRTFTGKQWKALAEDLRVTDPTASSFVQKVGPQGEIKPGSLYGKFRSFRGGFDNVTRTQLWVNGMQMGLTPEDAARLVHEFDFNYSELSNFDRDVMKRLIPFYVFPRKAIENQVRTLLRTPGRVINVAKPFLGRDDENASMTQWEGEGFKLRLDRNGKTLTMLNGVDLPVRSLDMLWRGGSNPWLGIKRTAEGIVGSAAPIIKVAYMGAAGEDPFRGRPFGRLDAPTLGRTVESWPAGLKDIVGWKKTVDANGKPRYQVNEERARMLLEASTLSRVFSTGDRYFRHSLAEPGAADFWLQFLTGLQYKTLNLDDEQKKLINQRIREAQDEAVKQGQLRQHGTYYKPK